MKESNGEIELTVMEAINILTNMSEIDVKDFSKKGELDIEEFDKATTDIDWKDPRQALLHQPIVRETFRILHRYLQNMLRKDQNIIKDTQAMKGMQAIMVLAQEAASKMDKYAKFHPEKHKPVSAFKEYTDLQKYYKQHVLKQMPQRPEIAEDWEEDIEDAASALEVTQKGLSDLEVVRQDNHYELFYIKNESNQRYFNKSLLRHIRLIGNFDDFIGKVEGEDPLLRLREMLDREMYEGAKEMIASIATYIDDFYKEAKIEKDKPLVWNMNKALMALRMAANPKNLIENQSFKSCLEYYSDFHRFLRLAMEAPGYVQRITGEMLEDHFGHVMLRMTHALCCNLYMRKEPIKEGLKLIHAIIKRGEDLQGPRQKEKVDEKEPQLFADLKEDDTSVRFLLKHYPNGPILRILDSFREEEEFEGFDPLLQKNFPAQLYSFENNNLHLTVLRIPCPTKQKYINQVEIAEEFLGFLRFYKHDMKADKHLMVNVQNRTAWEEYTRCKALEETTAQAETYEQFYLLTLSSGTPFYNQEDDYESLGGAPVFIEQFAEQMMSTIDCGYFFPIMLKKHQIKDFVKDGMKVCHEVFFDGKTHLNQKERQVFIDIFHMMFVYRVVDILSIDSISFTCKDAIDVGMAQSAIFYTFTRLISDPKGWKKQDVEQLLWMLYSPALFIRERPILKESFDRAISAMEVIHSTCHAKGDKVAKELNKLYENVQFPLVQLDKSSS